MQEFRIEEYFNKYEGFYRYNLSSACCPPLSLNELFALLNAEEAEQLKTEILNHKLDYALQFGSAEALKALAEKYQTKPENFILTSGASEAIYLVFKTLFNPGDSIIVQQPIYQSLYQVAKDSGVEIIDWNYQQEKGFEENFKALEQLSKREFKALVINNPNNPMGIAFADEEIKALSRLLGNRLLIADEVFRDISQKPIPSIKDIHQNSIVISDLSKSYSMPGLRSGWIYSSNLESIENFSRYKNYLSLRNNNFAEILLPYVLKLGEKITGRNKKLVENNLELLFKQDLFNIEIDKNQIQGLSVLAKLNFETDLEQLIHKHGIFIAPGSCFQDRFNNYTRLGLANENLAEALAQLQKSVTPSHALT